MIHGPATPMADILGRWSRRSLRMLPSRIIAGCVAATMIAVSGIGERAESQQVVPHAPPESADVPLPDARDVAAACATLREWVTAFVSPPMNDAASHVAIRDATGVCIVLRRSGRVLGIGVDTANDDLMLRRAAGRAMNAVLGDPALASLSARIRQQERENPDSALTVDFICAELGRSLTIELEVAGKLVPLVGRTLDQAARKIDPSLQGMALRHQQSLDMQFPAQLRATNTADDANRSLLNLALQAGFTVNDLNGLPQRQDVGLYVFQTLTLTQNEANQAPFSTVRGDVLVPFAGVNRASIAQFADGLARHLMASIWPDPPSIMPGDDAGGGSPNIPAATREPLGIMGDYSVVADRCTPMIAPPLEQALAALALVRYAAARDKGTDAELAAKAIASAQLIMRELAAVTPVEADPRGDLSACAAIVYAVSYWPEMRRDPSITSLFNDAVNRVAASFEPASGFIDRVSADAPARPVPPHTQAIVAGAMSRMLMMRADGESRFDAWRVRKAIDAVWQSTAQPQHVALLPWIGWAEADFAEAVNQPLAHADELRLLIDVLGESRIDSSSRPGEQRQPDLDGGFAFTTGGQGDGAAARATSQTVRPAAWLASALKRTELVRPQDQAAFANGQLQTVRFLMQLSVRESSMGSLRNPARAMGGLRAALWDSDEPTPAQALGLITAAEVLLNFPELH